MRLSSLKRIECIIPFAILAIAGTVKAGSSFNKGSVEGETVLQITEKIYSNIFVRKREEHKLLVKHLLATEDYSKRYELLKLALKEILKILQEDGAKLRQSAITAESVFPTDTVEMEALARYLENTCFFAELILHLPDISYRILKTLDNWRSLIIASLSYSRSFVNILDQKSLELLGLLEQEIDESKRSDTYVNPYRLTADTSTSTPKPPKKKSKLKKGPQLSGTPRNEL
ncbi:coiled-coil domain-containing protein 134-like [Armigeres subalbatus]|uniref:coiled-coil domain-containing protein 134-like n=1 Tax=Armigeres subalbatus TaxID=124917 RepID=UPI002ED27A6C